MWDLTICYKWYYSQTPGDNAKEEAKPRRGVDTRRCANKDAGPQRWMDWGVPHRLEKRMSVSEDTEPQGGGL